MHSWNINGSDAQVIQGIQGEPDSLDSEISAARCTGMTFDGFYSRVYWADSQGFLGPGTHHTSEGLCQCGGLVTQVMQIIRITTLDTSWMLSMLSLGSRFPALTMYSKSTDTCLSLLALF